MPGSASVEVRTTRETVVAKISGETVRTEDRVPAVLRQGRVQATNLSGGVCLGSGEVRLVDIRSMPGNEDMYIGAVGTPYSGYGYLLLAGENKVIKIDNLNKVAVYAEVSGEYVVYRAEAE